MKVKDFSSIFIGPLYNQRVVLNKIDESIYDEILDLSDRFLIPSQVLNNLLYDKKVPNPLVEGLKNQSYISNLKNLINQKELLKIAKIFNESGIDYVFLKGSAINLLGDNFTRYSRDIDILVDKKCLSKSYELLKKIGYKYLNPLVSDSSKYIKYVHHLPPLSNSNGGIVEIHHRITELSSYEKCPLTRLILDKYAIVKKDGMEIKVPKLNHLIAHITYHAVLHHKYDFGPVFLHDIKHLKKMIKNKKELIKLLSKMNLSDEYKKIEVYIDTRNIVDIFGIYEKSNTKKSLKKNPKRISKLILTNSGRSDFCKIITRNFIIIK